jgi:hypothetical protein
MPRGGKRLGAGRKKGAKQRRATVAPEQARALDLAPTPGLMPLDYMLAVIRDPRAEWKRRDDLAKAAAPYCHERLGPKGTGKKAQEEEDAKQAGINSDWSDDLDHAVN